MTRAYLALGSNVGDRESHLAMARQRLEAAGVRIAAASAEENTTPIGGVPQADFLNQVLEVETVCAPEALLRLAKKVERDAGRQPDSVRWGPRELDIDILLFDALTLETDELTIPHPGLVDRPFICRELAQIAPALVADAAILVDYDPEWPAAFTREEARLRHGLGPVAVRIDHVGSTAVPRLLARAIIDIQVSVPSVADVESYRGRLEQLGYGFQPDARFPTYPFFRYPASGPRRHHLHVAESGSVEEREHLDFRDRLRQDPVIAGLYGDLKRELARRFFADRIRYSTSKGGFVDGVLEREAQP